MISDAYTAQFLLEGTLAMPPSIVWRELANEALGFHARLGDIDISIAEIHTRPAVRIALSFRCGVEEFSVYAPIPGGWFGKQYPSPADADLAERLKELLHAAVQQCAKRQAQAHAHPEEIRERIYRKLLFERPAELLESFTGIRERS